MPGEVMPAAGRDRAQRRARSAVTLTVANTGDRPIQVGSHYHFFETNPALAFEREQARGMRLDIPPGTAVRFEPGQTREVVARAASGEREVYGFRQAVMGSALDDERTQARIAPARRLCRHVRPDDGRPGPARRHRPRHRGRAGLHHLWRGGEVRRRQGDPRRHGAEPGDARRKAPSTPSSPTR